MTEKEEKMKGLISLEAWNDHKLKLHKINTFDISQITIACPKCNNPLDEVPGIVLFSNPPLFPLKCQSCDYVGYRY